MANQLQLQDDEALVLFDLLSSGRLAASTDTAEAHALGAAHAALEKQLVAPFASDYPEQLAGAKSSLTTCYGE